MRYRYLDGTFTSELTMTKGHSSRPSPTEDVSKAIENHITLLKSLAEYSVRDLVKHAEKFGLALRQQRLETNQIRKVLDAINQIKAKAIDERVRILADKKNKDQLTEEDLKVIETKIFDAIDPDIVLLKPKLAYAASRQNAVEPLQRVMSAAIDKTHSTKDFERLVQLIESIIAYHKAAGGK